MTHHDDRDNNAFFVVFAIAAVLVCIAIWVMTSSMEAASFNRLTGGRATTWDAMVTELRVTGSAKED